MSNKKSNEFLEKLVSIGEVIKPHGVKGYLKFYLYNENSEILSDLKYIWIINQEDKIKIGIEDINLIASVPLIKFIDINSRREAEKFRKNKIYLPESVFKENNKDLYLFDFIDCEVYFDDNYIGKIKDVFTFSGNDLLLVKGIENKEHYIPINKKLIKFFDIEDRKLIMNTIDGLLEVC